MKYVTSAGLMAALQRFLDNILQKLPSQPISEEQIKNLKD